MLNIIEWSSYLQTGEQIHIELYTRSSIGINVIVFQVGRESFPGILIVGHNVRHLLDFLNHIRNQVLFINILHMHDI